MKNDAPIHECESEIDHYTGQYVPYSLRRVCGFFNVPQIFNTWARACETGPTVYRPYPRRLESLAVCRYYYKGSTFSSEILKIGPAEVWTYGLPLSRPALIPCIELTGGGSDMFHRKCSISAIQISPFTSWRKKRYAFKWSRSFVFSRAFVPHISSSHQLSNCRCDVWIRPWFYFTRRIAACSLSTPTSLNTWTWSSES